MAATPAGSSGFVENALDLVDRNPTNLRHLGNLHAVLHPTPDARNLRRWNLDCRRRWHDRTFRLVVPSGAGLIGSTRGLRADGSADAVCWVVGVLTGGFDVNRASAAWRARVIRSRSSPRGCGCCCRLSKICSEWLISFAIIEETFREFGKLDLGSRGALRKRALMARSRILAKAA